MSDLPDNPFDNARGQQLTANTGGHPEREPIKETPLEEVEKAPELSLEVQKAGVTPIQEQVKLPTQDQQVGMMEAGEAVPVSLQPTQTITLTDDQIKKALHQKVTESILWLATWCVRQLRVIHHKLSRSGG